MRIKVLTAMSEGGLEKKVNRFLEVLESGGHVRVTDIKFSTSFNGLAAMISYEDAKPRE